ncbi:GGDEF domain-containing protein [Mesorhizobium sp. SB112]|uniref:GGDEF domain-containing protein n=1 Tax=Mesorhizobium sp. SB112 TaxID=3151853 RepID=UPI0032644139
MLDFKTAYILWATAALTVATILFVAWIQHREARSYLLWGGGFFCTSVGLIMITLRGQIPDFLSIEFANGLVLFGLTLWLSGVLIFDQRRIFFWVLLPPAIWVAGMFVPMIRGEFAARVSLFNVGAACGFLLCAVALLPRKVEPGYRLRRALAAVFLVQFIVSAGVALSAVLVPPTDFKSYSYGLIAIAGALLILVASVALGMQLLIGRSQSSLRDLAARDPLTGVFNRRGLLQAFAETRTLFRDDDTPVAMLIFDLDHFKKVNDRFGHLAGDSVLAEFARGANKGLRPGDLFGRIGGEEFAAILPATKSVEAQLIAERIRSAFSRKPIDAGTYKIAATVSVGIAVVPARSASFEKLLLLADHALYSAKANGRDQSCLDGTEADPAQIVHLFGSHSK